VFSHKFWLHVAADAPVRLGSQSFPLPPNKRSGLEYLCEDRIGVELLEANRWGCNGRNQAEEVLITAADLLSPNRPRHAVLEVSSGWWISCGIAHDVPTEGEGIVPHFACTDPSLAFSSASRWRISLNDCRIIIALPERDPSGRGSSGSDGSDSIPTATFCWHGATSVVSR